MQPTPTERSPPTTTTRRCRSNIRPVREVLRHPHGGRRGTFEKLLAPRHRRTSSMSGHTVDDVDGHANGRSRALSVDDNRLATIMSFLPLRTAFGEFCRKALCSEVTHHPLGVEKHVCRHFLFRSPLGDEGSVSSWQPTTPAVSNAPGAVVKFWFALHTVYMFRCARTFWHGFSCILVYLRSILARFFTGQHSRISPVQTRLQPIPACCRPLYPTQSFEFLVDAAEFKAFDRGAEGGNDEIALDFAGYLAIVNSYIKYDSHSEINIGCQTKRDIMDYIKFEAYLLLGPVS